MKPIELLRRAFWAIVLRMDRRNLPNMTAAQRLRAAQITIRAFRTSGGKLYLKHSGLISYQDAPAEDAVTVVALFRTEVAGILRAERGPRC